MNLISKIYSYGIISTVILWAGKIYLSEFKGQKKILVLGQALGATKWGLTLCLLGNF